jgi:hypothetical protein
MDNRAALKLNDLLQINGTFTFNSTVLAYVI